MHAIVHLRLEVVPISETGEHPGWSMTRRGQARSLAGNLAGELRSVQGEDSEAAGVVCRATRGCEGCWGCEGRNSLPTAWEKGRVCGSGQRSWFGSRVCGRWGGGGAVTASLGLMWSAAV